MKLKEHEKFIAFVLLGAALMILAVMIYLHPLRDSSANSGVLQILNMIIGALISGFGAAAGALLKAGTDTVTIANKPDEPVPTTDSGLTPGEPPVKEELPDYAS